jgi:hypothetical protein
MTYDDYLQDKKLRIFSKTAKNVDELRSYLESNGLYNKDAYFVCLLTCKFKIRYLNNFDNRYGLLQSSFARRIRSRRSR